MGLFYPAEIISQLSLQLSNHNFWDKIPPEGGRKWKIIGGVKLKEL
jgi:hypothetical protein